MAAITKKTQRKVHVCPVSLKEPQGIVIVSLAEEYKRCTLSLCINSVDKNLD